MIQDKQINVPPTISAEAQEVLKGLWHVFPQYGMPESKVAIEKSATSINDHLHQ